MLDSTKSLFQILFVFLCAITGLADAGEDGALPSEIRYIVLEGGGPDQGPGGNVAENFVALAKQFGAMPATSDKMIACGVQQLRILSRSAELVRRDVIHGLDLAECTGIPVFFHVDSCYGWGADGEERGEDGPEVKFWQDAEMREWDRFPVDAKLSESVPRLWINWGQWCTPAPAAPAFGSRKFVEFAASQLDKGVLMPLAERLSKWRENGREYLFAGINIAWEAHFPDYGQSALRQAMERAGGVLRAEFPLHARGMEMDRDLVGRQLGYASLHWRGWNETRLNQAAAKQGVTRNEKFEALCHDALHDYMEALAKACHQRGLSADHVYTHIVALASVGKPGLNRPPIWTAVNRYSTPGFTMDNRGGARFDLAVMQKRIRDAKGNRGIRFGVVESYFRLGDKVYFDDVTRCRRELETMFAAGAGLQVFYGGFPLASRTPEVALDALRQWLDGEPSPSN